MSMFLSISAVIADYLNSTRLSLIVVTKEYGIAFAPDCHSPKRETLSE